MGEHISTSGTNRQRSQSRFLPIRLLGLLTLGLSNALGVDAKPAGDSESKLAVPDFVMKHAPLIWIHSQDAYQPSDIEAQVKNTIPKISHKDVENVPSPLTLDNLDKLNDLGGESIYMTSKEGITELPSWFEGVKPNEDGKTEDAVCASVVVRDHGDGVVDAFYFYFNAYNEGNTVFGIQFGNHVGDWEHNMIRFRDGNPEAIWYSQHASGHAFKFDATDKQGDRPIGFLANGSHAVYAREGYHDHTIPTVDIPIGLLIDKCDEGTLWDPMLNAYFYSFDEGTKKFTPYDSETPVNWLYFKGKWGDQQLPDDHPEQIEIFGQRKYTSGPTGPLAKGLDREDICPEGIWPCIVRNDLSTTELDDEETMHTMSTEPDR